MENLKSCMDEFSRVNTKVCISPVGIDIAREGPTSNSERVLLAGQVIFCEFWNVSSTDHMRFYQCHPYIDHLLTWYSGQQQYRMQWNLTTTWSLTQCMLDYLGLYIPSGVGKTDSSSYIVIIMSLLKLGVDYYIVVTQAYLPHYAAPFNLGVIFVHVMWYINHIRKVYISISNELCSV